jgi:acetoin utilization deacetylase AcuC-like enzyme
MGDAEYLAILHQILLPVAFEVFLPGNCDVLLASEICHSCLFLQFNPEMVIISAGYDAAMGCPEVRRN